MSKPNPSLLFVDPDSDGPFVIKSKPNFEALPQSDTLSRLKAFLPMMKQANEEVEARAKVDPKSVIIDMVENEEEEEDEEFAEDSGEGVEEREDGPEKKVIQMNLMLVPDDSDEDVDAMEGQEDAHDDTGDEEIDEEGNQLPLIERQARAAASSRKPQIQFLGDQQSNDDSQSSE